MTIKKLINFGYFSEELPPPFTSEIFGNNLRKVQTIINSLSPEDKKAIKETNFVKYTIPKVGIQRRINGIPNPYHQYLLSKVINNNWSEINKHYKSQASVRAVLGESMLCLQYLSTCQ